MNTRLLTVPQAADVLSIGRTKLYQLIQQGELAAVHIGRSVRVPVTAIEEFTARLEQESRWR